MHLRVLGARRGVAVCTVVKMATASAACHMDRVYEPLRLSSQSSGVADDYGRPASGAELARTRGWP